jgi:heme-degrading monooxygenase HmoA
MTTGLRKRGHAGRRWLVSALGSVLLGGCAISTPYPRLFMALDAGGDDLVVLVLTRIVVNADQRDEFDLQTKRVIDSMPQQPGLIGFSARRQLFGSEAWTMSVWASDEARAAFVRSSVHQQAMRRSQAAIASVELKRLSLPRAQLPGNWTQALALMNEPEGWRSYEQ